MHIVVKYLKFYVFWDGMLGVLSVYGSGLKRKATMIYAANSRGCLKDKIITLNMYKIYTN